MPHVIEVLVEEAVPQAMPRVGKQRLNRSAVGGGVQPVNPCEGGEVSLDGLDCHAERAEVLRYNVDGRLIRGNQQIETLFGAACGQFVADAG